jgi:hypothetical protein
LIFSGVFSLVEVTENFMWKYFEVEEGRWYVWNLNGAAVYLRREGNVWQAAVASVLLQEKSPLAGGPEPGLPPGDLPEYFATAAGRQVALHPYFYEKPYCVNFQDKIRLMPEAEIRLDLALPPVLRLELAGGLELVQFTPFLLSETWSGNDSMSGFLCLSLPVQAHASRSAGGGSFIHGELIIRNRTKTILNMDCLVLSANSLNIYEKEGQLRCEGLLVDAIGGGEFRLSPQPGVPAGYNTITAAPKNVIGDIFMRRSADLIKNIARI